MDHKNETSTNLIGCHLTSTLLRMRMKYTREGTFVMVYGDNSSDEEKERNFLAINHENHNLKISWVLNSNENGHARSIKEEKRVEM